MPEKLLTIDELSVYLSISEAKIINLVEDGVLSAYKIGGEFLRFRKDQIDAIQSELSSRISDSDKIEKSGVRERVKERHSMVHDRSSASLSDWIADFFYFYDFYIVSSVVITILIVFIFSA